MYYIYKMKLWQMKRRTSNNSDINRPIIPAKKVSFVINNDYSRASTASRPGAGERLAVSSDALRSLDVERYGEKVQLSSKTLDKMFNVKIDDPNDVEYDAKKLELQAEGKTPSQIEALIGKKRQITKRFNMGDSSLMMKDRLELIERAVQGGFAHNREALGAVMAQLALLANDGSFIEKLSDADLRRFRNLLRTVDLPESYQKADLEHRIWTLPQYREMSGLVNIFIMSNLKGGRTLESPLLAPNGGVGTKLIGYDNYMRRNAGNDEKYIDLENRIFITRERAMQLANEGVDMGILGGYARPADGWDSNEVPVWALTANERRRVGAVGSAGESKMDVKGSGAGATSMNKHSAGEFDSGEGKNAELDDGDINERIEAQEERLSVLVEKRRLALLLIDSLVRRHTVEGVLSVELFDAKMKEMRIRMRKLDTAIIRATDGLERLRQLAEGDIGFNFGGMGFKDPSFFF